MERFEKEYILFKRTSSWTSGSPPVKKKKTLWYYRLQGESVHHTTGKATKREADEYVKNLVLTRPKQTQLLREYLEPFFTDLCPHVTRLRSEGKSIGDEYIEDQRRRMNKYIFADGKIAEMSVGDIKRAHILDFRQRLVSQGVGARTINRTIGILKVAFKEGLFREELERDPTAGVGNIKYEMQEIGVFSEKEMQAIFASSSGPFRDHLEYCVFLLAASTGMRRGELLALTWGQLDFDGKAVLVDRAMKTRGGKVGEPKWGRIRRAYLTDRCVDTLRTLKSESSHMFPGDLVFGYADGSLRRPGWWKSAFESAMLAAGFMICEVTEYVDRKGERRSRRGKVENPRNLRPHSFRHSLATLLADAEADPTRIRQALGWSGPEIQANYTHELSLDPLRDEAGRIIGG